MVNRIRVSRTIATILVLALVGAGLGATVLIAGVVAQSRTGALTSPALNEQPELPVGSDHVAQWLPDVWLRERLMEPATRVAIEAAYVRAWFALDKYQTTGITPAIDDAFSGPARNLVLDVDPDLLSTVDSLSHNLQLTFYALDGATVAFTDIDASFARTTDSGHGKLVVLTQESYDVVMVLEDGYWRIRQLDRHPEVSTITVGESNEGRAQINGLDPHQAVSLPEYSATEYSVSVGVTTANLMRDFAAIEALGFTAIRVAVPIEATFDERAIQATAGTMKEVLTAAHKSHLRVIVVLRHGSPSSPADWAQSDRITRAIAGALADEPSLLMWDLSDRPDESLNGQRAPEVFAFLIHCRQVLQDIDDTTPATISWASPDRASDPELAKVVDVVSVHLQAGANIEAASVALSAIDKVMTLTVDAISTEGSWSLLPATEARQASDVSSLLLDLRSLHLAHWTIGAFRDTMSSQTGLVRLDGTSKPAALLFAAGADLAAVPQPSPADVLISRFWITALLVSSVAIVCVIWVNRRKASRSRGAHPGDYS